MSKPRKKPETEYKWSNTKEAAQHFRVTSEYLRDLRKDELPQKILINNVIHIVWRNISKSKKPNLIWNLEAIAAWMDDDYEEVKSVA